MKNDFDYKNWAEKYFSAEELRQWQELGMKYSQKYWDDYNKQWSNMFKKAESMFNMPPSSPQVQSFCKEWLDLVNVVYKDYPGLKEKTWEAMKSGIKFQMDYFNQAVIDFMDQAFKFYDKNSK